MILPPVQQLTPEDLPQPPTPVQAAPPQPVDRLTPLLLALADHATPTIAQLLAEEVTLQTATGEACHQPQTCAQVLTLALAGAQVGVLRRMQVGERHEVVQGEVLIQEQLVPFSAVLERAETGQVAEIRLYASTLAWHYVLHNPHPVLELPTRPTETLNEPSSLGLQAYVDALTPQKLAEDPTAAGLIAADLRYHDAADGRFTVGAEANSQAIQTFLQHFTVTQVESRPPVARLNAAGDTWLVVERELTVQQQAPVVPLPPTREDLHLRTLEWVRVHEGKVAEIWGYSDPLALLQAVDLPRTPTLH